MNIQISELNLNLFVLCLTQLPDGGLACREDVEVSIDLLAPQKAGRYVSHWRLATRFGHKFGHRLWVVIQVVPIGEQSPQLQELLRSDDEQMEVPHKEETLNEEINDYSQALDAKTINPPSEVSKDALEDKASSSTLNLIDRVTSGPSATAVQLALDDFVDVKAGSDDGFSLVDKPTEKADWFNLLRNDDLGVEDMAKQETTATTNGVVEETDAEMMGKGGIVVDKVDVVEQMHLQSLESMGFSNRNLNLLLLQKNDHNLQRTVDDLLAASGWYGALKDLEEMV